MNSGAQSERLLSCMDCLRDRTRLRLLRVLEEHELGVAELCQVLQMPQSTVSRHLKVLADCGYVQNERRATSHFYRMASQELDGWARRLWLLSRQATESWSACRQDRWRLEKVLRQRQSLSQAFFSGAAARWDRLRAEYYGQALNRAVLAALLPQDYVVADLGCGTGQLLAELAPYVGRAIGVDSSPAMLRAARRRLTGVQNVHLIRADLGAVPLEQGACDAAVMVLALSYVADPLAALREMGRIIRSGGRLAVVDLLPHDREDFRRRMGQRCMGFDPDGLSDWLAQAGFGHLSVRPLPPEPGTKGPVLFLGTAIRLQSPDPLASCSDRMPAAQNTSRSP